MKNRFVGIVLLLVAVCIAAVIISSRWSGDDKPVDSPDIVASSVEPSDALAESLRLKQPPLSESLGVGKGDFVGVGGIDRPKRDMAFDKTLREPVVSEKSPLPHPGNAPAVPKDANPEVVGLYAELAKEKPNRAAVSSLFAPEPFDQKRYEADKEAWLTQVLPGRVFEPAQPSPDVKPIASASKAFQQVVQGEKVILSVKADPGSPVTFYTPQIGEFSNRLTTQSVEASPEGIATATFTATAGTQGLVDILAASPVNSGQLRYRVRVVLPESGN
jgi:hypothetical protein